MAEKCTKCGKTMKKNWAHCPDCGKPRVRKKNSGNPRGRSFDLWCPKCKKHRTVLNRMTPTGPEWFVPKNCTECGTTLVNKK